MASTIPSKWLDLSYEPTIRIDMIDPHNINSVKGTLQGLVDVSVTDGYYSDTQISASIKTVDDNYIGGTWLRIIYDGEAMCTLGVSKISSTREAENGVVKTYDLQSVLWMLATDIAYHIYTIAKRAKGSDVIKSICKLCGKSLIFAPGCGDKTFSDSKAYDRSDSYMSIINDVCSSSSNTATCDPTGAIRIIPYLAPKKKSVTWELNTSDSNGVVLSSSDMNSEDSSGSAYNRTVVIATNNDATIVAAKDSASPKEISSGYRGWTRTNVHQVSDMQPFNRRRADQLVNQYIPADTSAGRTTECTCTYFPVKSGDIINYTDNGKTQKYLAQTLDYDLMKRTVKINMKNIDET